MIATSPERLQEAIAQHPRLWARLGEAWKRRDADQYQRGVFHGLRSSFAIVGEFDLSTLDAKLAEDFGPKDVCRDCGCSPCDCDPWSPR